MNGGHFEYKRMSDILKKTIEDRGEDFPPCVIEKFKEAEHELRRCYEMVNLCDLLLSEELGVDNFHRRWVEEVPRSYQSKRLDGHRGPIKKPRKNTVGSIAYSNAAVRKKYEGVV